MHSTNMYWLLRLGGDLGAQSATRPSTARAPTPPPPPPPLRAPLPRRSALQAASIPPRHPGRAHTHLKVAQLYITNPLLLHGRKFHLRLWVNVTGHRPLRAYMHARGLVLFSSQEYEPGGWRCLRFFGPE